MDISLDFDTHPVTRMLGDLQKTQIPFAASLAINRTAQKVREELTKEIPRVFSNPKPMTRKSIKFPKRFWSTKKKLIAKVKLEDFAPKGVAPLDYLAAQIDGGNRRDKRSEVALRKAGILPPGMQTVPGNSAKKGRYGITPGMYVKMLSQFRITPDPLQHATNSKRSVKSRKAIRFFVRHTGKAKGVWYRSARGGIHPFLLFVNKPTYRKRFRFDRIAKLTAKKVLDDELEKAMQHAISTMRT